MVRILVTPEQLNNLSQQMTQGAAQLRDIEGQLGRALGGLDWEARQQANVDGQVNAARMQARQLAEQAEALARTLTERAGAFQQADTQSSDGWNASFQRFRTPVPVPTPVPAPNSSKIAPISMEDAIHSLDDLLKPIDWMSKSAKASRSFDKTLEDIGRMLNGLMGQRGNIKIMGQFGEFLRNTSKGAGFLSNVLDLRDMNRYISGQLTNAEVAAVAVKAIFPIPLLNDRLAKWAIQNMVDPSGHWHGLVSPVQ